MSISLPKATEDKTSSVEGDIVFINFLDVADWNFPSIKIPYFLSILTIELDSIDSAYSHLFINYPLGK
jgi:hypothetical protein